MSLTLWKDISPLSGRLRQPSAESPHILVIGGGVTGLINSWVLLDKGYHVTIISSKWANSEERLTSQIAGALWEFPPAVCGSHVDKISLANSKLWCMTAYHIWDGIASIPELSEASGVRMMPSDFFFPQSVDEDHQQLSKMCEIMASGVRGFYRSPALINERRVNPDYPHAVDAYEIMAPIIDTDQAMGWLMNLVKSKGAKFITETINDDLLDIEDKLLARYSADCIINCTGLNGQMTAGDNSVYPIRGALIRVLNDGSKFPKVEAAMTITADAVHDSGEIVFLVPRNDNILLIGGCAELHKTELNLTLDSPIVKKMRHRCEEFLPCLKDAELDASYPLAQGLRPFRQQNVRVERELRKPGSRLVHSYGQGGAGWSLSFGCAEDVAWLVEEVLNDAPARSLQTITEENFREAARTQRYMAANL